LVQGNLASQFISCGAKLRERSINTFITPWPPTSPRSRRKWLAWTLDREVIIPPYQKFWSRIEAVVDASVDFIK
jgi:hypothetical protein